jgi:hypothetical protein
MNRQLIIRDLLLVFSKKYPCQKLEGHLKKNGKYQFNENIGSRMATTLLNMSLQMFGSM